MHETDNPMKAEWIDVGSLADLEEPGSRGCELEGLDGMPFFVVRKGGTVRAYRNRCPHTGAPLEWQPHQFLDLDGSFIQCALHGALFRVNDGSCLRGPCVNQALEALPLEVREGRLLVDVSSLRSDGESAG